ncbi:hypothetical protein VB738_14150 [Cyanobium gracile UHCC 0139]|uniref:Uncharacterized protein n=1 Tax=Cyanobium gracile UHCC 0139 TaxID=3110308 RepID=A0ABU5RX82_9CYAN|nr:hypothetical protein [Cyanobium gracile]MEA5392401.1 hypothetical protein [Cyanobium gracile UHCC 0139]
MTVMDPVSPVAQLAVAAISGAAFLISMVVIPFPESKADSSAGISPSSQTSGSIFHTLDSSSTPLIK